MMVEYMEQGVCGVCGSEHLEFRRIEKDVNVLVWYECPNCGWETIEVYEFTVKGVTEGEVDG